jgi:hypothetical protein
MASEQVVELRVDQRRTDQCSPSVGLLLELFEESLQFGEISGAHACSIKCIAWNDDTSRAVELAY